MKIVTEPPVITMGRGDTDWTTVVAFAQENAGKWVEVGEYSNGMMQQIKRGQIGAFIAGTGIARGTPEATQWVATHWTVTTRSVSKRNESGNRRVVIYIRWDGE